MSQCVPNWDLDDPPNPLNPPAAAGAAAHGSRSEYEVAELTWVNGHPSKHGLGGALRIGKPVPKYPSPASWDKSLTGGGGTLESVVDQATGAVLLPPSGSQSPAGTEYDLVPWIAARQRRGCSTGTTTTAGTNTVVDALVPCSNRSNLVDDATGVPDPSGRNKLARVVGGGGGGGVDGNCSVSGSAASMGLGGFDTCDINGDGGGGDDVGFTTSTSPLDGSPDTENTSCGRPVTIVDEHDSASHSLLSQRDEGEKKRKGDVRGSSVSTKRSRAAAVHNQSERKRRDRINQRMKTLQKLVPNSSKTDKASMLDEVIDYLKQLQAQVQMMNRMNTIPQMMMPMPMQQLQMAMMAQMAQMAQMGMGMGMAMGMDMNPLARSHPPAPVGMPSPPVLHPSAFLPFAGGTSWDAVGDRMATVPCSTNLPPATAAIAPTDPFSAFMACQSPKPMNMDAFNRMAAAMYQQLFQQQSSQTNPNSNK